MPLVEFLDDLDYQPRLFLQEPRFRQFSFAGACFHQGRCPEDAVTRRPHEPIADRFVSIFIGLMPVAGRPPCYLLACAIHSLACTRVIDTEGPEGLGL